MFPRYEPAVPGSRGATLRHLGVDYGTRRIGLAVCDDDETIVSPSDVLSSRGDAASDAQQIAAVVVAEDIGCVVVGLPLNMDDSLGPQAKRTRAFADALAAIVSVPVALYDERLTSFEADELAAQLGLPPTRRKGKARKHSPPRASRDALAAAVILQDYLAWRRSQDNT